MGGLLIPEEGVMMRSGKGGSVYLVCSLSAALGVLSHAQLLVSRGLATTERGFLAVHELAHTAPYAMVVSASSQCRRGPGLLMVERIHADGSTVTLSGHVIGGAIEHPPDDVGRVQDCRGMGGASSIGLGGGRSDGRYFIGAGAF